MRQVSNGRAGPGNVSFVNCRRAFVADSQSQSALREWREHMSRPLTLAGILGVGAILGISGPFGTSLYLDLLPRLAYWLATAILTYAAGALVSSVIWSRLWGRIVPVLGIATVGLATTIAVTPIILALNALFFGADFDWRALPEFLVTLLVISLIISALTTWMGAAQSAAPAPAAPVPSPARPTILDRLPVEKRGALVAEGNARKKTPEIIASIEAIMRLETAGDPITGLKWNYLRSSPILSFTKDRSRLMG